MPLVDGNEMLVQKNIVEGKVIIFHRAENKYQRKPYLFTTVRDSALVKNNITRLCTLVSVRIHLTLYTHHFTF